MTHSRKALAEKYRIGSRGGSWKEILKDLFFGMFYYQTHQQATHLAVKHRDIVHVLLLGEFMGLPLLGTFYSLRLVPWLLAELPQVTERVLRDVDVLEMLHEYEAVH